MPCFPRSGGGGGKGGVVVDLSGTGEPFDLCSLFVLLG